MSPKVSKTKDALVNYWGTLATLFAKLSVVGVFAFIIYFYLFITNLKLHLTRHKIVACSKENIKDSFINFH